MRMDMVHVEEKSGISCITLNRPEVRNAFDDFMIMQITDAFRTVKGRVVLLSGVGKVFCAGGDLNWMRKSVDYTESENLADAERLGDMFRAVDECPIPVIAKVHGAAYGGGLGLVCCCDVVIAEKATTFCFSEVKLGLAPAVIGPFAVRKMGMSAARRYFLTAEAFDADEAKRVGLVHEVVAAADLDGAVGKVIEAVMAAGPYAVMEAKRLIREVTPLPLEEALRESAKAIAALRVSGEGKEGVLAFLEKRPPGWF